MAFDITQLQDALDKLSEVEQKLGTILPEAQQSAEEFKAEALADAHSLVTDARSRVQKLVDEFKA